MTRGMVPTDGSTSTDRRSHIQCGHEWVIALRSESIARARMRALFVRVVVPGTKEVGRERGEFAGGGVS